MQKISKIEEKELKQIRRSQALLYILFPKHRYLERLIYKISDFFDREELALLHFRQEAIVVPFEEQLLINCYTRQRQTLLSESQILSKAEEIIKKNRYLFKRELPSEQLRGIFLDKITNLITIGHDYYKVNKNPHRPFLKALKRLYEATTTVSETIEKEYPGLFTIKTTKEKVRLSDLLYQRHARNPYALINSKYLDFEKETKKLLEQYKWHFKKAALKDINSHIYKEEILVAINSLFSKPVVNKIETSRFLYELPVCYLNAFVFVVMTIIFRS